MITVLGSYDSALLLGCLDLIYTTGTSGRVEGLRMMTKVETGSHLGMSLVHSRKVSAMILEPVSTGMVLHQMQCSCHVTSHHDL